MVAILALAMVMLGCISHKEQDETPTLSLNAPQQLYVSFESVTSRTSVQDDKRLQWSEGDEISYFPFVNSNLQYQWQYIFHLKDSFQKLCDLLLYHPGALQFREPQSLH